MVSSPSGWGWAGPLRLRRRRSASAEVNSPVNPVAAVRLDGGRGGLQNGDLRVPCRGLGAGKVPVIEGQEFRPMNSGQTTCREPPIVAVKGGIQVQMPGGQDFIDNPVEAGRSSHWGPSWRGKLAIKPAPGF